MLLLFLGFSGIFEEEDEQKAEVTLLEVSGRMEQGETRLKSGLQTPELRLAFS
jgi:hypothetical protein